MNVKEEIADILANMTRIEVKIALLKAEITKAIAHTDARFKRTFRKSRAYVC